MVAHKVMTHIQLWGEPFPVGGEWDGGVTPPGHGRPGRVTVRRTQNAFVVVFHDFNTRQEEILATFPPNEEGEILAKEFALSIVDRFWGWK